MTTWNSDTVHAAQGGDLQAFESLVRAHHDMVFAVCLGEIESVQASEEAAHDSCFVAWRRLAELRDPKSFSGWPPTLTRNLARTQTRGRRRRIEREDRHVALGQQAVPDSEPIWLAREQRAFVDHCMSLRRVSS